MKSKIKSCTAQAIGLSPTPDCKSDLLNNYWSWQLWKLQCLLTQNFHPTHYKYYKDFTLYRQHEAENILFT